MALAEGGASVFRQLYLNTPYNWSMAVMGSIWYVFFECFIRRPADMSIRNSDIGAVI